jgi:hypothetical protein
MTYTFNARQWETKRKCVKYILAAHTSVSQRPWNLDPFYHLVPCFRFWTKLRVTGDFNRFTCQLLLAYLKILQHL